MLKHLWLPPPLSGNLCANRAFFNLLLGSSSPINVLVAYCLNKTLTIKPNCKWEWLGIVRVSCGHQWPLIAIKGNQTPNANVIATVAINGLYGLNGYWLPWMAINDIITCNWNANSWPFNAIHGPSMAINVLVPNCLNKTSTMKLGRLGSI